MFTPFLFHLRASGLKVSLTEWLGLMEALAGGYARCDLDVFYTLARALLVKKESQFDLYDNAFASFFEGVDAKFELDDELMKWLANPVLPRGLSEEERQMLEMWDLDRLREEFQKRLREQDSRHDGGNRWIGTGGASPFGYGGIHPAGIRVGGVGGGRSAVQVASARRFRNLRNDRVLDTRQIGAALRRLRRLSRDDGIEELDLEETIDTSAKNGGEIDLVFAPPRTNQIKLLLLMDVGGTMDPHTVLCERLFSAAHAASHFKRLESYFFHNCVYEHLYSDIAYGDGPRTEDVLARIDATWTVVLVGDAWMAPYELTVSGGGISYWQNNATPGLVWLQRLRDRCPRSVWLNPESRGAWDSFTIRAIGKIFPMFELTLDGLGDAVDVLRGNRTNVPGVLTRR
ncbi:MAG: hypothetical protein A2289_24565 [Deltaproteobacteria bacterium RIFOXYA12_FULL_58_15]|nr:MAG: hypothetical protein A2289_24565 [Deltaproteobacteria bacterium RIFOXYA12_FULL_58_15]OGR12718.1 MAG: hypothetical protein A2341_07855 [Deltaproteobacteria bacterium RIFOXYB12_FULL_58_9]